MAPCSNYHSWVPFLPSKPESLWWVPGAAWKSKSEIWCVCQGPSCEIPIHQKQGQQKIQKTLCPLWSLEPLENIRQIERLKGNHEQTFLFAFAAGCRQWSQSVLMSRRSFDGGCRRFHEHFWNSKRSTDLLLSSNCEPSTIKMNGKHRD